MDLIKSSYLSIVVKNAFHLYFLQFATYLFPLITFPYLFRILGSSNYGYISFVIAYFVYFQKLCDYSFNIYSVRDISLDPKITSDVFSRIIIIKVFLFLLSVLVSFFIYLIFLFNKIDSLSFGLSIGSMFAFCFTPYWLFRGKQEMKYISFFNIINKAIMLALIIIFITNKDDYLNYFIIDFAINIIVLIFVNYFVIKKYKIQFIVESFKKSYTYFGEGLSLFISETCAFVYSSSNILILGLFVDISIVGYYAISEKILNLSKGLFSPFIQASFPTLTQISKESKIRARKFIVNTSLIIGMLGLILFLFIYIFTEEIIGVLIGGNNFISISALKLLSPIIFSYSIAVVFSNLFLHSFGLYSVWSKLIYSTFLFTILFLVAMLCFNNNYINIVIYTSLFSEIFISIMSIIIFVRAKKHTIVL